MAVNDIKANISVIIDLTSPAVVIHPKEIVEGDTVTLQCQVSGTQPLKYTWFKDGNPLEEHADGFSLKNINRNETGKYSCAVENSFGKKTSTGKLINVLCKKFLIN